MSPMEQLAAGDYISLATRRRDGTFVRTPVGVASDGQHLFALTPLDSGKAKRLRNFSDVRVAACKANGTLLGEEVAATAVLLDADGTSYADAVFRKKYNWFWRTIGRIDMAIRNRHLSKQQIGIRISLAD